MAKDETESKKLNVETMTSDERANLSEQLKAVEQKDKWKGSQGIWSSFRRLGKDYANMPMKDMPLAERKEKLVADMKAFISERLE